MNNKGTFEENNSNEIKVAVNSIQRTLYVQRLYVDIAYPRDNIIPYDKDNLYPNKVKEIAQRSGTTIGAINKLSEFISGEGFPTMGTIVNRKGQTLWDILRHIASSKAMFRGFALHFNYNMLGQIVEINPVNFEFVRWHKSLDKYVVNPDWSKRYDFKKQQTEYYLFNPNRVINEIQECGGIENYKGQLYYWIPNKSDYYTPCTWDSVLDDAQFEAEAKLYGLSSIQNDYSLSGIISYPKSISDEKDIENIRKEVGKDKGSANAGGIRVVGAMPTEGLTNWKWFTPMSRNNIDNLHTNQKEDAKFNIYAAFNMPPILAGVTKDGMFNQDSFADAFHYYNSATETDRKEVERELNKILSFSAWQSLGQVEITPKNFQVRETGQVAAPGQPGAEAEAVQRNETLTNLSGRQLQGVQRIARKYRKDELTKEQAGTLLADGFGFNDKQIEMWLIKDEE